ncbi:hypothetical protein [Roseovarius indicus]|uniref:hypothetical protein n=1 Tax=Roseovarius indicus TaxID=540747 RepID=UPI0032EC906C
MNWYVAHIAGAIFLYSICAPFHLEAQERPCLDGSGAEGVAACDARLADPSNLTPSEVAAYRRARAGHRLDVSDHAGALADLDALSQFDAASTLHHYRRALALKALDRPEDAMEAVGRALDLDPQHVDSLLLRAELAVAGGEAETALADAGLAITLQPDNAAANTLMADALRQIGATDAADRSREQAETVARDDSGSEAGDVGLSDVAEDKATEPDKPAEPASAALSAGDEARPAATAQATNDLELVFWNDVKNSTSPEELEAFVAAFPESVFVTLATLRIERLKGQTSVAVAKPPEAQPVVTPPPELPPTRALRFQLRKDDGSGAAVWKAMELPTGGFVFAGITTDEAENRDLAWVARYDADGKRLWQVSEPSDHEFTGFTDLVLLGSGNLMLSEVKTDNGDEPPLMRARVFDMDGNPVSDHEIEAGTQGWPYAGLAPLEDGGAALVSETRESEKVSATFLMRFDAEGAPVWRHELEAEFSMAAIRVVGSGGHIFVLGRMWDPDRDKDLPKESTVWLRKYMLDGEMVWHRDLNTGQDLYPGDLEALPDGGVLAIYTRDEKNYAVRVDADGTKAPRVSAGIGQKQYAYNLEVFEDGGYAVAGSAGIKDDYDNSVAWITWYDAAGKEVSRRVFGDKQEEHVSALGSTHDGGLLVVGQDRAWSEAMQPSWVEVVPRLRRINAALLKPESSGVMQKCVRRAAGDGDTQNPYDAKGAAWEDFDAEAAKAACTLAAGLYPENAAVQFHYGRTMHKLEAFGEAAKAYAVASDLGYVRANLGLAVIHSEGPLHLRDEIKAVRFLQRGFAAGDAEAAFLLGERYQAGKGVLKSDKKAAEAFRVAADGGMAEAQFQLAMALRNGKGVTYDTKAARTYFTKASDQGHVEAKVELARMYLYGIGGSANRFVARKLYIDAAEAGHAYAAERLAQAYRWGDDLAGVNQSKAAEYYHKAVDNGSLRALADLGYFYMYGVAVPENKAKAISYYRRGVAKGDGLAEYYLGSAYRYGKGLPKNEAEAMRLFNLAVADGQAEAMVELGYMYRSGIGTAKDEKKAFTYFNRAANRKSRRGLRESGWMLCFGEGTTKSLKVGLDRLKEVAKKEDGLTEVYLGYIYETVASVRDPRAAARHYYKGLRLGEPWPVTRNAQAWNAATARELQQRLKNGGHYDGPIDGAIGPASVKAMKALCRCG